MVKNNPGDAFFVSEGRGSVVQTCEVMRKNFKVSLCERGGHCGAFRNVGKPTVTRADAAGGLWDNSAIISFR